MAKRRAPTLKTIKAKVKRSGMDGLNIDELRTLKEFEKFLPDRRGAKKPPEPVREAPAEAWIEDLPPFVKKLAAGALDEMENGKGGIARLQAIDRLKEFYKEYSGTVMENLEVAFVPIRKREDGEFEEAGDAVVL